jgi:hypothetical protein
MVKKSLVKALFEEQMEFCYTQQKDVYGVSKNAIIHKQGVCIPKQFINFCKNKHGVEVVYSYDDDVYIYVKEIK